MSNVIRLSKKNIEGLEKLRSGLIEYYKKLHADEPDLIEYEIEHWNDASYSDLIDRAVFAYAWNLKH